jgi:hypothetical protein
MTRLRPAGAGPGQRALLSATALGAVLVTVLALSFGGLVSRSQAHPLANGAGAPADVGAQLVGAAERAIAPYVSAPHGGQREDAATPVERAGRAERRTRVEVLRRSHSLALAGGSGERHAGTFGGRRASEPSSASGPRERRPHPRSR